MLCRNGGSSSTHKTGKIHLMALQFCNGWGPCTVHFSVSRYACWGEHGSFHVIPALLWEYHWQSEYYLCANALYFTIFSSTYIMLQLRPHHFTLDVANLMLMKGIFPTAGWTWCLFIHPGLSPVPCNKLCVMTKLSCLQCWTSQQHNYQHHTCAVRCTQKEHNISTRPETFGLLVVSFT